MTKVISRLYNSYDRASQAVRDLEAAGVPHSDISIVANNSDDWYSKNGGAKRVDRDVMGSTTAPKVRVKAPVSARRRRHRGSARGSRPSCHSRRRPGRRGGLARCYGRRCGRWRNDGRHCRCTHAGRCQRRRRTPVCGRCAPWRHACDGTGGRWSSLEARSRPGPLFTADERCAQFILQDGLEVVRPGVKAAVGR